MPRMAFPDEKKFLPCLLKVLVRLGVGLAGLGVVALILWLPPWQVEQVRVRLDKPEKYEYRLATLEDEYRRTLVQSIGGFFLLVGLYLTWRRIVATEDNVRVAAENVSVALKNVSVAQEGHITDRFTRAIEQLGDDKIEIRLGGIYALERIAKDSEKDHGPIMEVLTAYVRENAPRQEENTPNIPEKPPTDIQAILTVIGRRETTGNNRGNDRLNLSNTQLRGANLTGADLRRVDLTGANLSEAFLKGANLTGTELMAANLSHAYFLTAEQVRSASNWHSAKLPDYLKPPVPPARPT